MIKQNIRVPDPLWAEVEKRADALKITTSAYVRRALEIGMRNDDVATAVLERAGQALSSKEFGRLTQGASPINSPMFRELNR